MGDTVLQQFVADPKRMRLFQQERLMAEVTELMCKTMKECGVNRSQLAEQLEKTKGRISQLLCGEANLRLRTVADVFTTLGKTLTVSAEEMFIERPTLSCFRMVVDMKTLPSSHWEMTPLSPALCEHSDIAG